MAKDISFLRIKFLNIELSKSVINNSLFISGIMVTLYIVSIFFSLNILKYYLNDNLDSRLRHEIEHISNSFKYEKDSVLIIRQQEFEETDLTELTDDSFFLQIYSSDGKLFLQSKNSKFIDKIPLTFPQISDKYFFDDIEAGNNELRFSCQRLSDEKGRQIGYVQLSSFNTSIKLLIKKIITINILTFPLVVIFILLISFWISKKTFSPINKIIELSQKISATNLSDRLTFSADPNDELGKLRDTLNDLFERLELQVKQISSFSDNASHQLMTPLTALNSELDFLLRDKNKIDSERESLLMLKEQTESMISIIKSLLLLARYRNSDLEQKTVFDFSKMVSDNIKQIYKNYKIKFVVTDEIYMRGRPDYFLIAVQNLIDNALKYSDNDWVTIFANQENEKVIIRIEDFGMGIDHEEKEKVFERFYRTEKVERLGIKGYGLGLSLVRSIISSMHGAIEIQDNQPRGTKFIITLPALEIE